MAEILPQKPTTFLVGYALAPKNLVTFIQPSFVNLAKEQGIELTPIDMAIPLIEQGPFDCIVHKFYTEDWKKQLEDYSSHNPNVVIVDKPDAIEKLHYRVSMLEAVSQLRLPSQYTETCLIPNQLIVEDTATLSNMPTNLKFPVIAKPVLANASVKSHSMSLVFNSDGLKGLEAPIVLQEFVNHGGVIFKVYVAGVHVKCVERRSLPDVLESDYSAPHHPSRVCFSQISNLPVAPNGKVKVDNFVKVEMPEMGFVEEVAKGLREGLGLHLFNFDMIRDSSDGNRYYVIDINYFPGYATMPSYEKWLTDFFCDVAAASSKNMGLDASKKLD